MFNKAVTDFLTPFLTKGKVVLEYGSGESTKEISGMVETLLSIEHNAEWFKEINKGLPNNCILLFVPSTGFAKGTDGTYEEFKKYIEAPKDYGTFDVILIDGRARVGCAEYAKNLADKDTHIFIDDYNREEYHEAEKYLTLIDRVDNMAHFKLKDV